MNKLKIACIMTILLLTGGPLVSSHYAEAPGSRVAIPRDSVMLHDPAWGQQLICPPATVTTFFSNVYPCVPKNPVCRKNFMVWGS